MDFNLKASISLVCALLLGCTRAPVDDTKADEHTVGNRVTSLSLLSKVDGTERKQIVIFDDLVRKIHQFDVNNMTFVKSLAVKDPSEKHYLLAHEDGNYIIDLSLKHISIFNKSGREDSSSAQLQGELLSTAFRSDLGLLIVYDKNSNSKVLKLDVNGDITKSWKGGNVRGKSISAGDILSNGMLALALEDDTFCLADLNQTLNSAADDWVLSIQPFATGLVDINWVAPLPEDPNLVLVHSPTKLALINLTTKTVATQDLAGLRIEKYSKSKNPHLIMRNQDSDANPGELKIFYVKDGQITSRKLQNRNYRLMISDLDLIKNQWTFVESSLVTYDTYGNIDETKEKRSLTRYKFSNGEVLHSMALPSGAQLQLGESFVFSLFPTKVGYAVKYNLSDSERKELSFFNLNSL